MSANPVQVLLWLEVGARIAEMIAAMFPEGASPAELLEKIDKAKAEGQALNAMWLDLLKDEDHG